MRTWEVICTLASAGLFMGGSLVAQATAVTPAGPHGTSIEGLIGTGGALSILGALLYYLITKHNPRQDERYDKMVSGHTTAMTTITETHAENLNKAFDTFRTEMGTLRDHNDKNIDKLVQTVNTLATNCKIPKS
jgi:hypothetical protein